MDNKDELIAKLKRENAYLKSLLEQNGISYGEPNIRMTGNTIKSITKSINCALDIPEIEVSMLKKNCPLVGNARGDNRWLVD